MHAPPALYDPKAPLLAKIFSGRPVFPAGRFADPSWLTVLRACGLKHQVSGRRQAMSSGSLHSSHPPSLTQPSPPPPSTHAHTLSPRSQVDAPTFLDAARDLERQGQDLDALPPNERARVLDSAKALVAHLREPGSSASPLGKDFFTAVGAMAIVPATLGVPGSSGCRQVLAR
jgi:sacsin